VVIRYNHGMTIAYLPLGHDATVSWGSKDFRFKNSTDFPIRLEATVEGSGARELTVRIIGTKLDDTYIETERVVLETFPIEIIRQNDDTVPAGETRTETPGQTGYLVEVFKLKYDVDGNLIERWSIGKDRYNKQDRLILVGPELPPETEEPPGTEEPGTEETPGTDEPPGTEETPGTDEPPGSIGPPGTDEPPETIDPPNETEPPPSENGGDTTGESDRQEP